jgi:hypothetical protein
MVLRFYGGSFPESSIACSMLAPPAAIFEPLVPSLVILLRQSFQCSLSSKSHHVGLDNGDYIKGPFQNSELSSTVHFGVDTNRFRNVVTLRILDHSEQDIPTLP